MATIALLVERRVSAREVTTFRLDYRTDNACYALTKENLGIFPIRAKQSTYRGVPGSAVATERPGGP